MPIRAMPTAQTRVFYESDCQGQGSSLLIVFPWQSVPSDSKPTIESASGVAEQSFALDSSLMFSVDPF
jgi:hypothetical protein